MRRRYLVTYDVSDAKRLRKVFRALHGFGNAVQYSVFLCDLSDVEWQAMYEKLSGLMHLKEDRALIVDLGEVDSVRSSALETIGRQFESIPEEFRAAIL